MDTYPPPDIGHVSFSGLSEPCSIGSIVEVVINAHGDSSNGSVLVEAIAPSGRRKNCQVLKKGNVFTATFTPNEVGEWQIGILYDGEHIRGSPFSCKTYDANLVQVYGLDVGLVGQELKFSVNASQAGDGKLKVSVVRHGRTLPCDVFEQGNSGVYRVGFTPDGAGQYKIHVLYNEMEVKGSPFILDIADASSVSVYGENLRMASVDRLSTFMIHAVGADCKDITVTITSPSGKAKQGRIHQVNDVTYKVEWKAVEPGEHSVDVCLFNQSIYESPFVCNVGDPDLVTVRNMPDCIDAEDLFRDYTFEIDASAAGSGNLEIMINNGRVACRVREIGSRNYLASFTPTQAVPHIVEMRFNGQDVRLSPWKILVKNLRPDARYEIDESFLRSIDTKSESKDSWISELTGPGLRRAAVGKQSVFEVTGEKLDKNDIEAKLYDPSGIEVPLKIYRLGDKHICEYTINKVGEHRLEMSICGKKVDPYPLSITGYCPENVKIEPLGGGEPGQPVQFVVDAVDAGKGQLEISVNQGRVPNNVQMQGAGRCLVTFIPQYPGKYVIDVTFNGEQVQGCPIRVDILPKQIGKTVSTPIVSEKAPQILDAASADYDIEQVDKFPSGYIDHHHKSAELIRSQIEERVTYSSSLIDRPDHTYSSSSEQMDPIYRPHGYVPSYKSADRLDHSYRSSSIDRLDHGYRSADEKTHSPVSPNLMKHLRQESGERVPPEHPKSPVLLRKVDKGDIKGAQRFLRSDHLDKNKKADLYDSYTRDISRSPICEEEDRIGYTIAKYDGDNMQTVTNRSFTDDGRGTVTSVLTSETRLSSTSPARTYEYTKGTLAGVPDEGRVTMPTTYSETRTFEPAKPAYTTDGQIPRAVSSTTDSRLSDSYRRMNDVVKPKMEYDPREFVTDSRSYGFSSDSDTKPTSSTKDGRSQPPMRYFGEDVLQKADELAQNDVGMITTTYEKYDDSGPRDKLPSSKLDSIGSYSTTYSKSTFDPSKMHSNGNLKQEGEVKDSAYSTSSFGSYIARAPEKSSNYYSKDDVAPFLVLDKSEEFHTTPKNWVSQPEHMHKDKGEQSMPSDKFTDKKYEDKHDGGEVEVQRTLPIVEGQDWRTKETRYEPVLKESLNSSTILTRLKEMEPSLMPPVSPRATDYSPAIASGSAVVASAVLADRGDANVSERSYEINEPEESIPSDVVEKALTPKSDRKVFGRNLRKEEDFDETLEEKIEDDKRAIQLLEKDKQLPHSKPPSTSVTPKSTPKTTPKLSLKFNKDVKEPKAFDFGKSRFTSKHEIVRKMKDVDVKLESLKLGKEDQLRVVILPPAKASTDRFEIEPKVKKTRHNYEISFRPNDVGTYKVMTYINGIVHPLCPFPIRVYDASEIIVGEIVPQSTINDTVEFTVDAGRAGFGNLEMAIKDSEGVIIPSHVAQLESGTAKFLVTFSPTSVGMHTVNITFNKEVLKNSPFEVNIVDSKALEIGAVDDKKKDKKHKEEKKREEKEKLKKEKEERQLAETLRKNKEKELKKKKNLDRKPSVSKIPSLSRVGKPAQIIVSVYNDAPLDVVVHDPSKNVVESKVSDNESGAKMVEFTPTRVGDHEIDIKCGGVDVQGSPFTCRAYDPAKIGVGSIPNGVVDQPVHFIVDASEAGVGNLEVAVNEGRIPSMAQSLGQFRYDISFVPRENIDHTISIRFNNEPVPGSQFTCHLSSVQSITASGSGLERVPVGHSSEFYVFIDGGNSTELPTVRITDSQENNIPIDVSKSSDDPSKYIISYIPKVVGNHQIEVEYNGNAITGSPFISKAFDAKCAKLTRVDAAYVGRPCTFTIDAARAGAGNMEIIVSVDNRNVPNYVQAEGQAKFKVSFTPQEAKDHVISVKFNGEPIPGSPMFCPVSEVPAEPVTTITPLSATQEQQFRIVGDLSTAQVGVIKGFDIDLAGRQAECNVIVTDPNGRRVSVQLDTTLNGCNVHFTPQASGIHEVSVKVDGKESDFGPYIMNVSSTPKIMRVPSVAFAGKQIIFNVDTNSLGRQDIRIEVTDEEGRMIPVRTQTIANGIIQASCKFRNPGRYSVNIMHDGKRLVETKTIIVLEAGSGAVAINKFERGLVGQKVKMALRVDNDNLQKLLSIVIIDAAKNPIPVSLHKVSNGIFEAEFTPYSEGIHKITITIDDQHIKGSPFNVTILDLSAVRVIGLKNDRVGVEQRFNVDWSNSGGSEALVHVTKDDREVPCSVKKIKPGLHVCAFTPKQAGLYQIDVSIDGTLLPECPYECIASDVGAVRARGDALSRAQRGKTARFEVSMGDNERAELDVFITDVNNSPLPVRCYKQQDDSYWVEFTPEVIGPHKIEVTFGEAPIAGSPFHCEVVDPKKVVIKGISEPFIIRQPANIIVNREFAGNGELTVEVTDPAGQPLKIDRIKSPSGDDHFSFLPVKLGPHRFTTKLTGFHVNGTPYTLIVEEQGRPSVHGQALDQAIELDQPVNLTVDTKKQKGGIKVEVKGPHQSKVRHSANKKPDGNTEIIFTPNEVGQYTVNVEFNGKIMDGSPFIVNVIDPRKVLVNDEMADEKGVFHLAVQQRNIIDVDATAAGSGKLRAEVRDWEGKIIGGSDVESLGYGKHRVIFTPPSPGKYSIYLYWSESAVQDAYPIHAVAEAEQLPKSRVIPLMNASDSEPRARTSGDQRDEASTKITLRGDGLTKAVVKEQSEFIIDGSDLSQEGRINCTLVGQKADIPVRLTHLGNNVYKATYTPIIPGIYELEVTWDGRHVLGSPSKVNVDSYSSPAELISVDTNTLKIGVINEDIKTVINTRRASPGQLSAQCMGPSKLAYCELYDHRDGTYTLSVRPTEIGKHTLVVKYSDEHVPGSPFLINVSHPPDASKVRVYGPGIEHGILSTFKSNFIVETRGAGAGQLTVRVRGPKGAFNVEMQREKKQERTIHCKYEPKEPGDYQVEVKWHGEHVPGSPFLVMIVDTEQELQRFLRGEAPSPQPATPFVPPGWIGTPPPMPLFMGTPGMHPPFPAPHPALSPPHPQYGPILPYVPPPAHMRGGGRPRFASGY